MGTFRVGTRYGECWCFRGRNARQTRYICEEVAKTCTRAGTFSADDGGRNAINAFDFAGKGGSEKVVHHFFERGLGERAVALLLHAVSGDGRDNAMVRHKVDQQKEMGGVQKGTITGNDLLQLFKEELTRRFNAQALVRLPKVV